MQPVTPVARRAREVAVWPAFLRDPAAMGTLPAPAPDRVLAARAKAAEVQAGNVGFGVDLVVPSFRPNEAALDRPVPATLPVALILHSLFSDLACSTETGQVAAWPVTVFRSDADLQARRDGRPCLMMAPALFKTVIRQRYSTWRELMTVEAFDPLRASAHRYDSRPDDARLTALSGLEPATRKWALEHGSHLLLPAEWVWLYQPLFVNQLRLRDLADLFATLYHREPRIPGLFFSSGEFKLSHRHRTIWLGRARPVFVSHVIRHDQAHHVESMARCRAFSNRTGLGGNSTWWSLEESRLAPVYHPLAFGYGLPCWDEQLRVLNTAYRFFTGGTDSSVAFHMSSLLWAQPTAPVRSLHDVLQGGIVNDHAAARSFDTNFTRRQKYRANREAGDPLFATRFWGVTRTIAACQAVYGHEDYGHDDREENDREENDHGEDREANVPTGPIIVPSVVVPSA